MSFETRVFDLITTLRKDLRAVQAQVQASAGSGGTASAATETVAGVLRVATQADTDAGVVDTEAVTPLKLQSRLTAFAQPLSANLTTLAGIVAGATGQSLLAAGTASAAKAVLSLAKADVGLANVDNTADTSKPVSTAQQTALNLKANLSSPTFTGTPSAPTAASTTSTTQIATTAFVNAFAQPLAANLTTLAGILPGAMGQTLLAAIDAAAAKTALALTKGDVGLANVDNTADASKPVSTAQQTALNLKSNLASPTFTGVPAAPTAAAGTATTQIATTAFTAAAITAATPAGPSAASETVVGIVELATQTETNTGTDDVRVITPLKFQTRLAAYAQPLSNNLTTLAGVVSGAMGRTLLAAADAAAAKTSLALVKADVGLANVDNTSDATKPVSAAQQTALDLKANLASPALTGVPTGPTAAAGTNSTQLATTAYVDAASLAASTGTPTQLDGGTP